MGNKGRVLMSAEKIMKQPAARASLIEFSVCFASFYSRELPFHIATCSALSFHRQPLIFASWLISLEFFPQQFALRWFSPAMIMACLSLAQEYEWSSRKNENWTFTSHTLYNNISISRVCDRRWWNGWKLNQNEVFVESLIRFTESSALMFGHYERLSDGSFLFFFSIHFPSSLLPQRSARLKKRQQSSIQRQSTANGRKLARPIIKQSNKQ